MPAQPLKLLWKILAEENAETNAHRNEKPAPANGLREMFSYIIVSNRNSAYRTPLCFI